MNSKSQGSLGPGALRLFLASVVVLHHSFPLRMGAWAVFVFFLLSGYWIAKMWDGKYARANNPLKVYIVSRWWRLAPVFYTCTILGVLAALFAPWGKGYQPATTVLWWIRQGLILFSASATNGFVDASGKEWGRLLPPSWSLDVEMQFYLVAPLLLLVFNKLKNPGRLAIVAAAVTYLLFAVTRGEQAETPRLDLYLGFFCLGLALSMSNWRPSKAMAWGSFGLFFAITFALMAWGKTRSGIWYAGAARPAGLDASNWHTAWWVVGALLCAPYVAWNVKIKSSTRDRWLGNLAFPLYMFHWIPRDWYYYAKPEGIKAAAPYLLMNWVAAFVGAILILQFIDGPFDKWRARWVNSNIAAAASVAAVPDVTAAETSQATS